MVVTGGARSDSEELRRIKAGGAIGTLVVSVRAVAIGAEWSAQEIKHSRQVLFILRSLDSVRTENPISGWA